MTNWVFLTRKHFIKSPSTAYLSALFIYPVKSAVAAALVEVPEQVAVGHLGINNSVPPRHYSFYIPAGAFSTSIAVGPFKTAIGPALVAKPQQFVCSIDGVDYTMTSREWLR